MKKPSSHWLFGLMATFALACSGTDLSAVGETGRDLGHGGAGETPGGDAGTVNDGAISEPFDPDSCNKITMLGSSLQELGVGGAAPTPLGGEITPGTYVLDEMYKYSGVVNPGGEGEPEGTQNGPTGYFAQKTLVLGTGTYAMLVAEGDANGLGAPVVSGGTYTTAATNIIFAPLCPAKGDAVTYGYQTEGLVFALLQGDSRQVFHRQP